MATLQKFKLLATQCAISPSPSRSPSASPVFHLRRRTTLRRLLTRSSSRRAAPIPPPSDRPPSASPAPVPSPDKPLLSHTLKDLFVSSPPSAASSAKGTEAGRKFGLDLRRAASPGRGPSRAFRHRVLRRVWRPVLLAIPE